ncbi:(2Fe-2S)-binding protein [Novosphingobium mangrovi (ex Huang et al. 2023)]|uniref:(2Fe-2S)-binding protein n=1 Tax=Novosphingobium mangrovi (ex Huang et al. 2023) TaxID=2976432 RepID=A0ABT2I9H1_9SPHN|nr:(2Fe-2S)-binding protein [Novosphingobium mangrovi (ex Huang et al. 2023)]MCT2401467.1 (2Fe-2S)-binding protein [Novosphingobium mangrovi (ex Huang et al. 2023)]
MTMDLTVNRVKHSVTADPEKPLLWVLREDLHLLGAKFGCGAGLCGACTVLLDGQPVRSCLTPVGAVGEAAVTTIEDVASQPAGQYVLDAWADLDVPQCGYCQAGQIVSATWLLGQMPDPQDEDIDAAMSGNICRCSTYLRIRKAIKAAAKAQGKGEAA